ncbi:MAG: toll/interleukin-1 receptor domain-containing protein, partial [Akkermansia sp.]|nr:toll/interleukin-1 receptor domain-containing protein [Akkermansia sp.]
MLAPRIFKFFAFISYSRKDAAFANKLQRFLENFKLPAKLCKQYPGKPTNLRPIYRDKTDLGIDKLNDALQSGLDASKFLIVICSEHSAQPNDKGKNWINEEVRHFVSLDKENEHRVIPVLYRTPQSPRATECIPDAIKELEILAADVLDKGEERVFSDVVAKMLDLQPDELWDRWARTLKRRRIMRYSIMGAAASVLAGAGFFAWDFCVPKVKYYQDYVERHNIPEGISELTQKDISSRKFHYRFTEQYYKVQKVECCNSAGFPCEYKYTWMFERPVTMKLEHDYARDRVLSCDYLDKKGKVVVSLRFPDEDTITFHRKNEQGKDMGAGFAASFSKGLDFHFANANVTNKKAAVKRMAITRDELGQIIAERFQNDEQFPRQNEEGAYGRRYERDAQGRVVKMRYLSHEGLDQATARGVAGYDVIYGANGLAKSLTFVGEIGKPVRNGMTPAKSVYKWTNGNNIAKLYYDEHNKPSLHTNGFASEMSEYDSRGNVVKVTFLGVDGKPCLHKDGIAGMTAEYDSRGNVVKVTSLGVDGKPCLNKDGYAGWTSEYDSRGNEVKTTFLGIDGKPCLHKDGYAGWTAEYDSRGNEVKTTLIGVDGKPCLNKDGVASITAEYDSRGNVVKVTYLGVDGKPCLNKDGVASITAEYDSRGNVVKGTFLGVDGKPCLNKEGNASRTAEYDSR